MQFVLFLIITISQLYIGLYVGVSYRLLVAYFYQIVCGTYYGMFRPLIR